MKNKTRALPVLVALLGWLLLLSGLSRADSSKVQGIQSSGATITSNNPVLMGVTNGGKVIAAAGDATGAIKFSGVAVEDSTTTGQPFVVAGKDNAGLARVPNVTPGGNSVNLTSRILLIGFRDGAGNAAIAVVETTTNALATSGGINGNLDALKPSGVKTSNGTTPVQVVAGAGGKRVLVAKLYAYNLGTVTHTVTLIDGATGITIWEGRVPADPGNVELDSDNGAWQSTGSGALNFSIDGGGAAGDVKLGVQYVQK